MSINRKRGSIALARSLCYQINGAADDRDDMDGGGYGSVDIAEILSAEVVRLQEALTQPEQEPVAWVSEDVCKQYIDGRPRKIWWECEKGVGKAFYTTPPQRKWVGLFDDEIMQIWGGIIKYAPSEVRIKYFSRAIESKLKEVNT